MPAQTIATYDEIFKGVQATRAWLDHAGVTTAGSRLHLIEQTLTAFLADLELDSVADLTAKWDWASREDVYYALTEGAAFNRVHDQFRMLKSDRLPRSELKRALQGPLVPLVESPSTTDPRNVFLELDLASVLLRAGLEVTGFDDVQFSFDTVGYVTQCKRPFSPNSVATNVEAAWRQIDSRVPKGSNLRGLIALGVDKVLGLDRQRPVPIQGKRGLDRLVRDLAEEFVVNHQSDWDDLPRDRAVAIVLVFRFLCHTLPPINTISVANYLVLVPRATSETADYRRLRLLNDRLTI